MGPNFSTLISKRLESTVRALCPIIEHQMSTNVDSFRTEYALRRELVACILGSQVRYEMATAALKRMEQVGLLADEWWNGIEDNFEALVFDLLSGRNCQYYDDWCYRFPKARANQLAEARDVLARRSLSDRLSDTSDPKQIRQQLVMEIPGIGPKQASMFLRNISITYDLAILDIHVLNFMNIQNLLCLEHKNIGTLPAYERTERIVTDYADSLGYPVGYLDWAIWATMRAARELGL